MKVLYITGIFFAFFAQSVVPIPKDLQEMAVDHLNRARNSFAGNFPVANMNELVYDESLERTFSSCQVAAKKAEFDNRVIMFRADDVDEIRFDSEGEAQRLANDNRGDALLYKIIFHSPLTSVGCVKLDKPCQYPGYPGRNGASVPDRHKATEMCFFDGPDNAKITDNLKRGKPATQCPNGKSEKYENLCKKSSKSGTSSKSLQSETASKSSDSKSETSSGSLVSPAHILIAAVFIIISFYF
ncbi:hypothetical protein GCK72_012144 [Caenorhabditis remanei]|uniref:Uncharacterized protein n=1 Tax=Caenorhabditis remanei TaxID=31234 RepID=A0A6A5GM39_CAERE|nr:hypothetical protein GCK72_012144 [Caenorhabditis remanei]KAF1755694.1 hypothetical protein GCK72_012144 [Caenorhabditis remanei]